MIILLLKASIVITILLAFYKLLLERESFFRANRIYLLSCLFFASILPFIAFPKVIEHQGYIASLIESDQDNISIIDKRSRPESPTIRAEQVDSESIASNTTLTNEEQSDDTAITSVKTVITENSPLINTTNTPPTHNQKSLSFWLLSVYFFGVLVLFINLITQLTHTIWKIKKSTDIVEDTDAVIINLDSSVEPCSFFKYIFINPSSYDYETYEQILAHEKIHVNKLHSIDLLLSEIAIIIFWFNPFIWLLRKEIEKNIEYQTDDILVKEQQGAKEVYQLNLVKIASHTMPLSITTNYNQSLIKQRIIKMNAKKSNIHTYWKYAFVAPILFTITLLINKPIVTMAQAPLSLDAPTEQIISTKATLEERQEELIAIEQSQNDQNSLSNKASTNDIQKPKNKTQAFETTTYSISATNAKVSSSTDCKELLAAIRIQDISKIKELLKSVDSNCIDPEPEFDKIIHNNKTYWKRKSGSPLHAAARDGNIEIANLLIDAGADVAQKLEGEGTPLITASLYGQLEFAKLLINKGAQIERHLPNEGNALIAAASNGHTQIVRYYISLGADIQFDSPNQGTALIAAANNGQNETVEFLLAKGARINYDSPNQGNALIAAAGNGYEETSELLISKGASIDYDTPNQGNALIAAANNGQIETVKTLLENGAKIDHQSPNQGNPLIAAANNGHFQTVEYLLSKGAEIDFISPNQGTPLIAAANNGHVQTITLLLQGGADINIESSNQGTALIAAANNGHTEVIEYLLAKGAEIDQISPNQGSALIAAANNGHLEAIRTLISNDAQLNVVSQNQGTALIAAANNGHLEALRALLSHGAQINKISQNQGTALIAAANNGHTRSVKFLIENGANKEIHIHGHDALTAARRNGHHTTVKYLKGL